MPSFTRPSSDADAAQQALRGLAHATRSIEDPSEIYAVLGSLTQGLASLAQALHQLGQFHDTPPAQLAATTVGPRAGRAACAQVSWELHRAAEIVHQVRAGLNRAHESEATIIYHPPAPILRTPPSPPQPGGAAPETGLSL